MVYLIYHIVTILHRTLKRNSSEKPLERVRGIFKTVDLVDTRYHVFIACQRLTDVDQFFMRDVCGADGNIYVRRAVGSHSPGRTYDFLTVQTRVFTYGDNRLTNYIIRFHAYQKISKPKRTNTRGIISNFFSLSLSLSLSLCFFVFNGTFSGKITDSRACKSRWEKTVCWKRFFTDIGYGGNDVEWKNYSKKKDTHTRWSSISHLSFVIREGSLFVFVRFLIETRSFQLAWTRDRWLRSIDRLNCKLQVAHRWANTTTMRSNACDRRFPSNPRSKIAIEQNTGGNVANDEFVDRLDNFSAIQGFRWKWKLNDLKRRKTRENDECTRRKCGERTIDFERSENSNLRLARRRGVKTRESSQRGIPNDGKDNARFDPDGKLCIVLPNLAG